MILGDQLLGACLGQPERLLESQNPLGARVEGREAEHSQQDGTLATDGTKLDKAISTSTDEVRKLLSAQGSTPDSQGFMVRFQSFLDSATGPDGQLDSRSSGLQTKLDNNQKSQDAMQTRLDATQKRITTQYQNLDTAMAKANALSSYVTQQISMLNKQA